ncbi:MAG: TonB-dependent hemoglobin/transferrin/lactoferrin family receptor [Acidobacteriota bacterium]
MLRSLTAAHGLRLALLLTLAVSLMMTSDLPAEESAAAEADAAETEAEATTYPSTTFAETVTVAATRSERTIKDTPGQIDVISSDEISELGYTNVTDLVRFTPGVYVEGDLTRLGTSGFNIRGIGGNRVLTQIDGIPTAEQFDFGPFSVTQYSLDLDTLESAEIVRSAGSALYGSDALGGVVSLVTRGPRSYLGDGNQYLGLRVGFDDRAGELSESLTYARGNDRWQGSVVFTHRDGEELDNQGDVNSEDFTRTSPNPIDRQQDNLLLKIGRDADSGSRFEIAFEWFEGESETERFSARAPASPFSSAVLDSDSVDTQNRQRISLEQSLVLSSALADSLIWRAYLQEADTEQITDSVRQGFLGQSQRDGLVSFDQETFGLEAEVRKAFGSQGDQSLTYGLLLRRDNFDGLRDRTEFVIGSGIPVPTSLTFPTKYFPESEVEELGLFAQGELSFGDGRVRLIPGLRFDRFDLDPDEDDVIFLSGNPGQPEAVAITDEAVSPKLGVVVALSEDISLFGQYARGFRAPPMSAVNNGFTNPAGGYRTLPNAELEPETSDNFELGLRGSFARGSFSITAFDNTYDDFIETVFLGFNPAVFLVEFQPQNINEVEISGFELAGDVRFGQAWRLRGAYSDTEGDNVTDDEPLESIAPPRFVAGLRYAPGRSWGVEATATLVQSKDDEDLPSGSTQFRTPSYEVFDVAAWLRLNERFTLQLSGWNLTDETYWQWAFARGQSEGSATLDRYTSPGRSFGLQVRAEF